MHAQGSPWAQGELEAHFPAPHVGRAFLTRPAKPHHTSGECRAKFLWSPAKPHHTSGECRAKFLWSPTGGKSAVLLHF